MSTLGLTTLLLASTVTFGVDASTVKTACGAFDGKTQPQALDAQALRNGIEQLAQYGGYLGMPPWDNWQNFQNWQNY
jgi:hypothetical protein